MWKKIKELKVGVRNRGNELKLCDYSLSKFIFSLKRTELLNLEVINQTMYAVLKTAIDTHLNIEIYFKSAQTANCVWFLRAEDEFNICKKPQISVPFPSNLVFRHN